MKIELIDPETLKSAAYNPRQITREELNKLIKSIKQFGFVDPALVRKQDNMIVGGHQRVKAAIELGLKEIPVVYLDITENDAKLLNVALNKISGDWDEDKLTELLAELKFFDDIDELLTGFDEDELDKLLADLEEPKEGLTDEDAIPEDVKTVCKEGQLWQLGEHRLLCGDATKKEDVERLMDGNKADMVFTDPPYGLGGYGGRNKMALQGDDQDVTPFYSAIPNAVEVYVWGRVYNLVDINFKPRDIIVWRKNNFGLGKGYRGQYEICFYNGEFKGSDSDVWEISKDINYKHPTQKPVELCCRAIKNSKPKQVLDLFLGSGSTLIACEKTNRICYGMEIDPHYCDVIIKRWEDFTGQKAELLDATL